MLKNNEDFDEAYHTCSNGLLSGFALDQTTLREAGERILGDAVERLQAFFES